MLTVDQLLYPLADAVQIKMTLRNGRLYGQELIALDLVDGIPITIQVTVVDSVVDDYIGTVGALLHFSGKLYLALINDERAEKLTFFVVDGAKAGIAMNMATGRVEKMDNWSCWSRKKFYSMIAPGVIATFTRSSLANDWTLESEGPEAALAYVKKRLEEDLPRTTNARDLNKEIHDQRMLALTGKK